MSKYKVGDKVVLTVSDVNERGYCPYYRFNNNHLTLWKTETDEYTEPLSTYTEPLEAEITRLLAENERLKDEYEKMYATIEDYESHESQGAETAWELARKITCQPINGGFNRSEFEEIFNEGYISDVFEKYTYPEAAAKVAKWKEAKEEIKVGDIVKIHEGNDNDLCVLYVSTDKKYYNAVDEYGAVYNMLTKGMITKTGRHIDVDSFLKQIGGEQE